MLSESKLKVENKKLLEDTHRLQEVVAAKTYNAMKLEKEIVHLRSQIEKQDIQLTWLRKVCVNMSKLLWKSNFSHRRSRKKMAREIEDSGFINDIAYV